MRVTPQLHLANRRRHSGPQPHSLLTAGWAWAKFSFDTPMPHSPPSLLEGPEDLLKRFRIARAAADPAKVPLAAEPSGWKSLVYFRLRGVPRTYYSAYSTEFLQQLAAKISVLSRRTTVGCILRQHVPVRSPRRLSFQLTHRKAARFKSSVLVLGRHRNSTKDGLTVYDANFP